ncbi:hypothetical protein AB1Y20_018045 [Prymnesium parvum]|uniref:Uncharacterized protein n=1 Tax=Prymnesium parvum TaxID=97485 RepID=A0AB34JNQ2_PRYPA
MHNEHLWFDAWSSSLLEEASELDFSSSEDEGEEDYSDLEEDEEKYLQMLFKKTPHQLQVLSRFLVLEKEKTEAKGNGKSVLKEAVRKNEITKTDATLLNRFVSNFSAIKTLELFNVFEQAVKAEKFHQFEMMEKVENIERKIKFVHDPGVP